MLSLRSDCWEHAGQLHHCCVSFRESIISFDMTSTLLRSCCAMQDAVILLFVWVGRAAMHVATIMLGGGEWRRMPMTASLHRIGSATAQA